MQENEEQIIYQKLLNSSSYIKIYKNKLVIKRKTFLFRDSEVAILLHNIIEIKVSRRNKKLKIVTYAKTYEVPWAVGELAEEIRQDILSII